jgi:hypothetical protein
MNNGNKVIKLKVFVFEKHTEETASIFRHRGNLDNIHTVNIKEHGDTSCIILSNPQNSSCIFTVNHLQLTSEEDNHLTLLMTERLESNHHNKNPEKTGLKLYLQSEKKDAKTATEILNIEKHSPELLEILLSYYAVILPGGGIIINLQNPVKNLELCICYSIEAF